jgi:hypothetical protein
LQSIGAEEVEFNMVEAERADKVRQMQEWGFDDKTTHLVSPSMTR